MDLRDLRVISDRDAGTVRQVTISLPVGRQAEVLKRLLLDHSNGAELATVDPDSGDCLLEVRKWGGFYQMKRGCHGSYGTWQNCVLDDALSWLMRGAAAPAPN